MSNMTDVETAPAISIMLPRRATRDEEIAAAIAAAVGYARRRARADDCLGDALEAGPGAWWTMGRDRQLSVNSWRTQRSNGR